MKILLKFLFVILKEVFIIFIIFVLILLINYFIDNPEIILYLIRGGLNILPKVKLFNYYFNINSSFNLMVNSILNKNLNDHSFLSIKPLNLSDNLGFPGLSKTSVMEQTMTNDKFITDLNPVSY